MQGKVVAMEIKPVAGIFDLAWHWGSAYDLAYDGKQWTAERKGEPQHTLYARTEDDLRDLIRQDYFDWKGA